MMIEIPDNKIETMKGILDFIKQDNKDRLFYDGEDDGFSPVLRDEIALCDNITKQINAKEEPEFTDEEIERIDLVYQKVGEFMDFMTDNTGYELSEIYEMADALAETISKCGYQVYFPTFEEDENGNNRIRDYI